MKNYSKLLSIVVFTTLGTILWSCKDETPTPNPTPVSCILKTAIVADGSGTPSSLNFKYNSLNNLSGIKDEEIDVDFIYEGNKVILYLPEEGVIDTMFTQGDLWVKSVTNLSYMENDTLEFITRIITLPSYTNGQVTKLDKTVIDLEVANGVTISTDSRSSTLTFTYDNKGNVLTSRSSEPDGNGNVNFTYSDSSANIKSNIYFGGSYYGEFFGESNLLPLLTGKFKLFNNPPSSITNVNFDSQRVIFSGMSSDANNNLLRIIGTRPGNSGPADTFTFTYDCK